MFTPEYTGSQATGYIGSKRLWNECRILDLGVAMSISGAAVSANMGSATNRLLTPTLALLNVRLGYWLRNPRFVERRGRGGRVWDYIRRGFSLLLEVFGWLNETRSEIYLTDGGHIENLGLFELLRRKCKYIIAIDAEADPAMEFPSLITLQRFARTDLGIRIDLPWREIQNVQVRASDNDDVKKKFHCAACKIERDYRLDVC